jgi:hypothetical protein
MNSANKLRGDADGFDLAILPNLRDVKSKDNIMTLLQYIAYFYVQKIDDSSKFPVPEPSDISYAVNVNFEDIEIELNQVSNQLNDILTRVEKVLKSSSEVEHEPFKSRIEEFLRTANDELRDEQTHFEECLKIFKTTVTKFCVRPKTGENDVEPNYFFSLWFTFCTALKDAWKRELQKLSKQR